MAPPNSQSTNISLKTVSSDFRSLVPRSWNLVACLGTSFCPLLGVPVEPVVHDGNPSTPSTDDPTERHQMAACFAPSLRADESAQTAPQFIIWTTTPPPMVWGRHFDTYCTTSVSSLFLLDHLTADQCISFSPIWQKLPWHLRAIALDLHGPGWDPGVITQLGGTLIGFVGVITQLGGTLIGFVDVFSKLSTDFS